MLSETVKDEVAYANKKTLIVAGLVPIVASTPLIYRKLTESFSTTTVTVQPPQIEPSAIEPAINVLAQVPQYIPVNMTTPEVIPTGYIADTSLEMLANVLDPLIQIMVAISFPIASVIMLGGCFFFMIGNSEKAWSTIMNAGLGYVLIQMSPLFLKILRQVGEAV